jgi:hypothetical protein
VTGVTQTNLEIAPKRLELLHELLPAARVMALLVDPSDPAVAEATASEMLAAARTLGLELLVLNASTEGDLEKVFAEVSQLRASGVAAGILRYFAEHYCSAEMIERTGRSLRDVDVIGNMEQFIQQSRVASTDARSGELLARIAELEERVVSMQEICDQRQEVIVGLDRAARERLDLIHRLDAEIRRLTS